MLAERYSASLEKTADSSLSMEQDRQVYVIDDDTHLRQSLHCLLSTAGFISWPFASASDFLDNLPSLKPAPILVDVRMEPVNGIELIGILSDKGIKWPIIVMTAHGEIPVAVQAIKSGATEFLEKPFSFESLEISLHAALAELSSIKIADEAKSNARRLLSLLSTREVEVMVLLLEGLSNKMVAYRLSLSARTIEMHRANALAKLKVKSIAEVAKLENHAGISFKSQRSFPA